MIASVREERVAWSLRCEVQAIICPRRCYPPIKNRKFASWYCDKTKVIGPDPLQAKKLADQWGIPRTQGKIRKIERGR